jgi:hypothetical protein
MTQTRRGFLTMTALAGAVGLLPPRGVRAAEPALETTTVPARQDAGDLFRSAICL